MNVVIANLTSRKQDSDTTTLLSVGDHPYIKHETVVHYADTRLATVEGIERIAQFPGYGFHDDCSKELLESIQQGVLTSRYTPKKIKNTAKINSESQVRTLPPPAESSPFRPFCG